MNYFVHFQDKWEGEKGFLKAAAAVFSAGGKIEQQI
jgi:hypothetical protein